MPLEKSIFLDFQATTPMSEDVLHAMLPWLSGKPCNPHSSENLYGWQAQEAVQIAANSIANQLGFAPSEIVFTSGATEANNLALLGIAPRLEQLQVPSIAVSAIEHKSVIEVAEVASKRHHLALNIIQVDHQGFVDLEQLENRCKKGCGIASIMLVNNEIGVIQDLNSISEICRKHGTLLHVDAVQAPLTTDVSTLGNLADFVTVSAHKVYGPMGVGALCIAGDLKSRMTPLCFGGGQQEGLRPGTSPTPLCVGMGQAFANLNNIELGVRVRNMRSLQDLFVESLEQNLGSFRLNGPPIGAGRHAGNINVEIPHRSGADILNRLHRDFAASTGSACSSGFLGNSHVLSAIGLTDRQASASLRLSFGNETSVSAIRLATKRIGNIAKELGP